MSEIDTTEKYKFTEKWFEPMIPHWKEIFKAYHEYRNDLNLGPIQRVLEIGCYEGMSTVWLCENILIDKKTKYIYDVIDSFKGSLEETGMQDTQSKLNKDKNFIENNFKHNILSFKHIKFNIFKGFSHQILPTLKEIEKYDFIYIDASHRADDTFVDGYYAHRLLKKGGMLIFDDYGWKDPEDSRSVSSPEDGIRMFCEFYGDEYKGCLTGYQLGIIKC